MAYFLFTDSIKKEKEIELNNAGEMFRDMTFIDDVIEGIMGSINYITSSKFSPKNQIFNLGNDHPINTLELLRFIEKKLSKKAKVKVVKTTNEAKYTHADITKAKKLLSFNPDTSFSQGMDAFLEWHNRYEKKYSLKLGIVGHGFVGKATDFGFSINVEKFIVDPLLNTTIQQLSDFNPEIIFICVPTPMDNDGSQDTSIINSVIRELIEKCPSAIKAIKSTVLPSTLKSLKKLDEKIIYNPEFLREKHANDDFIKSDMIIFGGQEKSLKNSF